MEKTFKYEDVIAGHMAVFVVRETQKAFTIEVPGISPQDAVGDQPAIAGTPTKTWSFPKEALARIFPHGREDLPALCDFIQAAWTFSRMSAGRDALMKPDEEQLKLTAVCQKFSGTLLEALGVTSYVQFRELNLAVDADTTTGSIRAAERQAEKDKKKAERQAKLDAKKAEKKEEREKAKAEKKAAKDKEKADKRAAKDKEKAEKKAADKAKAEAERKELVAKKNAEMAANGGKTASEAQKSKAKAKYTGKTKLSDEEKAEQARVAAEHAAEQERIKANKAQMDAEFEAEQKATQKG